MDTGDITLDEQLQALAGGTAVEDLSFLHKTLVSGADAEKWLNDLVTAGVQDLGPGAHKRSLLLSPTGHILAEFQIVRMDDGFLLLQNPNQPEPVEGLLTKYVLSSKVSLDDRTDAHSVFRTGKNLVLTDSSAPHPHPAGSSQVSREAAEIHRIRSANPAFPVDTGLKALPAEAGWESLVDFEKGCFLGQESVARVKNVGHPPALIVGLHTTARAGTGDPIFALADSAEVGTVTSASPHEHGTWAIARITWTSREADLAVMGMGELVPAERN